MPKASTIERIRIALRGVLACLCLLAPAAHAVDKQDKPLSAYYRETWTTRQGLPPRARPLARMSPPASMMAASWVASHQTMEQFCWNGVTGTVRYWSMGRARNERCDKADDSAKSLRASLL